MSKNTIAIDGYIEKCAWCQENVFLVEKPDSPDDVWCSKHQNEKVETHEFIREFSHVKCAVIAINDFKKISMLNKKIDEARSRNFS